MDEKRQLRILMIGAHPDDCEIKGGGLALKYVRLGHRVRFLSLTNGDTGHHEIGGIELARRRYEESREVARISGVEYHVWDHPCGSLMPTLENRRVLMRQIREFGPDLLITHRPNDYHPDHRYASQLVQDACYLVTVPNNLPLTEHLRENPTAVYFSDTFQKPYPFVPDVVVGIDEVFEQKLDMLHCHVSQMYEWLPYNQGVLHEVPEDPAARREWLRGRPFLAPPSDASRWREPLAGVYGPEKASQIRYAEAYEVCEYGAPLTPEKRQLLFPFYSD